MNIKKFMTLDETESNNIAKVYQVFHKIHTRKKKVTIKCDYYMLTERSMQ